MRVILLKEVENVGEAGEVVQVAAGFARNFLIPRSEALLATDSNMAQCETVRRQGEAVAERERRAAEAQAKLLAKTSLTATVRVGKEDRLFGSVTAQTIADLLEGNGLHLDRRTIQLEEPIRALGVYNIPILLHPDVTATVKLWVVKE